MHKLIHSDFEINLSDYNLSITEENSWFSDKFFTKYSFPFAISHKDYPAFQCLKDYNAQNVQVIYNLLYVSGNILEEAVLEIEEISDDEVKVLLRYGIDQFPNFDKKLSELQLQKFKIEGQEDIYSHASNIISKTWPAVNYNFPQIHTDKYDTSEPKWLYFEKILNNYKDGAFLINEVIGDDTYNRNIMQALPYYLYVLKRGFELGGYTLKGDVLDNPLLKKMLLYNECEFFTTNDAESIYISVSGEDAINIQNGDATFLKTETISRPGKYHLSGSINIYSRWRKWVWVKIRYRDTVIYERRVFDGTHHSGRLYTYFLDLTFETSNDGQPHTLTVESYQYYNYNYMIADVYADSIILYDDDGNSIPNVQNKNEIDLNRVVPEMTFGEYVSVIKNWFNFSIDVKGNDVLMNYIDSNINYNDVFNLQVFEIKNPVRKPNKEVKFLLKYSENEDVPYDQVLFSKIGIQTGTFKKDKKTKEIIIKALPLPMLKRNGVLTSHAVNGLENKLTAVIYSGKVSGLNLSLSPQQLELSNIIQLYWQKWLSFRLSSENYKWKFIAWAEAIADLKTKGKVFVYGNYHVVKSIIKTEIKEDLFEIEIEHEKM